jgi:hypothetical protein
MHCLRDVMLTGLVSGFKLWNAGEERETMTNLSARKIQVEWDIEGGYDPEDFPRGQPSPKDLDLPNLVEIPDFIHDEYQVEIDLGFEGSAAQVISDYLANAYGFTHFGWNWTDEEK